MKKVIGFGDYILRLNPEGYLKFIQANNFEIYPVNNERMRFSLVFADVLTRI